MNFTNFTVALQRNVLVKGRYMITMMVLLCYVNLSGMSLECIVIVLMNNSLLGGQECTDSVDIQQNGDHQIGRNKLGIIPRLNFTCIGRITSIRARVRFNNSRSEFPSFQLWRPVSVGSKMYNKIGEVQLQSDDQVTLGRSNQYGEANIILPITVNNTIEVQSGDVVGYYHPPDARYQVRTIETDGYILYRFSISSVLTSLNLPDADHNDNNRQPLIQFTIGKYTFSQSQ